MSFRIFLIGALAGVAVAFGITVLIALVVPTNEPGDNGGSLMGLGFCVFPLLSVVCGTIGVHRLRRRVWQSFERPELMPPKPRQRPYQRRDGSF